MDDAEYIAFLLGQVEAHEAWIKEIETKCDDYSDALSAIANMAGDSRLDPHLYARRELDVIGARCLVLEDVREAAARYRFCWENDLPADAWQAVDAATQDRYRAAVDV